MVVPFHQNSLNQKFHNRWLSLQMCSLVKYLSTTPKPPTPSCTGLPSEQTNFTLARGISQVFGSPLKEVELESGTSILSIPTTFVILCAVNKSQHKTQILRAKIMAKLDQVQSSSRGTKPRGPLWNPDQKWSTTSRVRLNSKGRSSTYAKKLSYDEIMRSRQMFCLTSKQWYGDNFFSYSFEWKGQWV